MKEFCALRAKTYAYVMDDDIEKKKAKGTKKCLFENYTDSLLNEKVTLKLKERFKNNLHKVYTEKFNKIALSSNDDKRLQKFTTYPHKTNVFKVCESEILKVIKYKDLVHNNKNSIKKANAIFKTSVTKRVLNRSIRFSKDV